MTENTAVAVQKPLTPLGEICIGIEKMTPQLSAALPPGVTPAKFIRTALQGIQTHRDADKLAKADRKSFYLAVQKAASDGLLLDGREATLVVFNTKQSDGTYKSEAQYLPMVQGLIKLARNSGEISTIESAVVYEKDSFNYVMGMDKSPRHEADWFADTRGQPKGVWAVITLTNGEKVVSILPSSKVMRVAAKSKNSFQYDPTKGDAWEEWWKKTAIKNALKLAPRTTDLDRAIREEEEAEFVHEQATQAMEQPTEMATEPPKRRKAVDKVKEHTVPAPVMPEPVKQVVNEPEVLPPENADDEIPI